MLLDLALYSSFFIFIFFPYLSATLLLQWVQGFSASGPSLPSSTSTLKVARPQLLGARPRLHFIADLQLQKLEGNIMFGFVHIANFSCSSAHRLFDSQSPIKQHMAAVGIHYQLGQVTRENSIKPSILFRYKYHDVFLSKIADHDSEHSYHFWYGRLPCF